jgi:Peptidase family M23
MVGCRASSANRIAALAPMARHRTTARALLLIATAVALVGGDASAASVKVPQLIFPLVGATAYSDDFGDARGQGAHEGIDILGPKRAPVVAVERGKVKFHTTSARAGCMLYLYGRSGTTYLYIHLNNDLTKGNDNTGRCVAGVSYAAGLKDGEEVQAGEPIAFNGDSGDADGIASHLHFEVHPAGGAAANPYPHLKRAKKLLFAAKAGSPFTAALKGDVVAALDGSLTLDVDQVRWWPGGFVVTKVDRQVELSVPPTTVVFNPLGAIIAAAKLESVKPGQPARAWTAKAPVALGAQLGEPLLLATERVELLAS